MNTWRIYIFKYTSSQPVSKAQQCGINKNNNAKHKFHKLYNKKRKKERNWIELNLSALMESFQMCTLTLPYHYRCRLLNLVPEPLLLSEFQISIHVITEQFSTLPQPILNELWSGEVFLDRVHIRLLLYNMVSFVQRVISGRVPMHWSPAQNHVCI